jgi:glycerophosphoryl diester phosphodiesterase
MDLIEINVTEKRNTLETYRPAVNKVRVDILEIDKWKTNNEHFVLNRDEIIHGRQVNKSTLEKLQQIDPQLIILDQVLSSYRNWIVFFSPEQKTLFLL